jgi:DNA (cytosine-5)-methyltransferase 1
MYYTSIEICAGAGGQALGLEQAGFDHVVLVELDHSACRTLSLNRPEWNVNQTDLREFDPKPYEGIDLLAGGVPCPPFSIASKQLGKDDERDLFPEALRMIKTCKPQAILLENVKGLLDKKFESYRNQIIKDLKEMGYIAEWKLMNASDFGVSQLRPRAILVGLRKRYWKHFKWPEKYSEKPKSVGELLFSEISSMGWNNAENWKNIANGIAPTLVGGSKKHGGADLGPTRAKKAWSLLGVNGHSLADAPPVNGFDGMPKLTLKMTALIQGFPVDWQFVGKKTPAYRQVGNAFPPPVAKAVGESIIKALKMTPKTSREKGSRAKLRDYFSANVGKILNSETLRTIAGTSEWGRRVRELRNEEGLNIVTHNDRADLKPGQYMLIDLKPLPAFERDISKETRALVLDRNGFTCQMCGAAAGELHPYDQGRKTRLHIGHIIDKSMGGTDEPNNLRAICSVCNEGASNLTLNRPEAIKLIAQVRRAPGKDQLDILKWLIEKYPNQTKGLSKQGE